MLKLFLHSLYLFAFLWRQFRMKVLNGAEAKLRLKAVVLLLAQLSSVMSASDSVNRKFLE